jgi:hypothetical protein
MVLPPIYLFGVWLSILLAIGVTSLYAIQVTEDTRKLSDALAATELVLTREQHLTQLDGLAAAAAHELGTPLATIFLISRELEKTVPRQPASADLKTLREQAQRCRDILAKITQLPSTGAPFDRMPLSTLIEEVVAPHRDFGVAIKVRIAVRATASRSAPAIRRSSTASATSWRTPSISPASRRGERVVEHGDRRDRDLRRRPGIRARHPEADRRTLSVAPARTRRPRANAGPRARRLHRPHAAGAHRRQGLVHQPDLSRSRRRGADRWPRSRFEATEADDTRLNQRLRAHRAIDGR